MCDFLEQSQIDELNPAEYDAWLDYKDHLDPEFEVLKINLPDKIDDFGEIPF